MKHIEHPAKTARELAKRRWNNNAVKKAFLAKKKEAADGAANEPPQPADVLEQERVIAEGTTKFESMFIKTIREMLKGHTHSNEVLYMAHLRHRRRQLLKEKLRRLLVAQQQGQGQ